MSEFRDNLSGKFYSRAALLGVVRGNVFEAVDNAVHTGVQDAVGQASGAVWLKTWHSRYRSTYNFDDIACSLVETMI